MRMTRRVVRRDVSHTQWGDRTAGGCVISSHSSHVGITFYLHKKTELHTRSGVEEEEQDTSKRRVKTTEESMNCICCLYKRISSHFAWVTRGKSEDLLWSHHQEAPIPSILMIACTVYICVSWWWSGIICYMFVKMQAAYDSIEWLQKKERNIHLKHTKDSKSADDGA